MVDNTSMSNDDKLFKVRPMVDPLGEKFRKISKKQELCIDEQVVPFEGHSSMEQCVPGKPRGLPGTHSIFMYMNMDMIFCISR